MFSAVVYNPFEKGMCQLWRTNQILNPPIGLDAKSALWLDTLALLARKRQFTSALNEQCLAMSDRWCSVTRQRPTDKIRYILFSCGNLNFTLTH